MGQKVNPRSMRLQIDKDWSSKWFATRDYVDYLINDVKIRRTVEQKLSRRASVSRVDVERSPSLVTVSIYTAKPGVVIGRGGAGAEELKKTLAKVVNGPVKVSIEEIKKPET